MPIKGPNGQDMDPAAMDSGMMGTLPPDAFVGASAADMAAMPPPAMSGMTGPMTVSYTHLTLPTILRV